MADLEKIVKIIFAGEDTDLSKTVTSVGSSIEGLAGKVGTATKPLADLTDAVLKIDLILAGFAAGALVVATNQAGAFGDSFKEISTLITAPADELESFRDDVLDYAKQSGFAFGSVTKATYDIISASGDWKDSLVLLNDAEKLSIAGRGELDSTTKLLVTSLNAYGKSAGDAGDFSDILFSTVKSGVTTLTELGGSLGGVTGLAASAGVPFTDLNTAVGALTGTVGDTSLAVTQVKGILTAIVKPSSEAAAAAKELGVEFNTSALEADGLQGFLTNVYDAADGNTEVMARLFGRVEALNGALILGEDASGKYADALQGMEDRAGGVEGAWIKMADGFELQNQRLINSIKGTLVDVGTPLLDDWGLLAGGLADIFSGVSVGLEAGAFDPVLDFVERIAGELALEFDGIAEALPAALEDIDWTEFTTSLQGLVDAGKDLFTDLFGDIDLTQPEGLATAIQTVIDAVRGLVDFTKGIVTGLGPFLTMVTDIAGKFIDMEGSTLTGAGNIAGWGKAINVVAGFLPGITAPLSLLSGSIGLLGLTQIPTFVTALIPLAASLGGLAVVFAPFAALVLAFEALTPDTGLGKWLKENSTTFATFSGAIDGGLASLAGFDLKQIEAIKTHGEENREIGLLIGKWADLTNEIEDVAETKKITIDSELTGFFADVDLETWKLNNLEGYEIKVTADSSEAETELRKVPDLWNKIILEDGTIIEVPVEVDSAGAAESAAEAKKKIDEQLPAEKLMEIKLQGEIDVELATIKATADTLQTAFEWTAKIEIAEFEAQTEQLVATAELVGVAWQSTADVISAALGVLDSDLSGKRWVDVLDIIDREQDIRDKLADATIKLNEEQILLLEARRKALESGKGLITIEATGIEPELELVLQKIIKLAQIQANEEGFGMLLGI